MRTINDSSRKSLVKLTLLFLERAEDDREDVNLVIV
jgi:hypothetical protein